MLLKRSDLIERYNKRQGYLLEDSQERVYASTKLREFAAQTAREKRFDIFFSHSYYDARVIRSIYDILTDAGYSVYVDWIEDPDADRANVSPETAALLRQRLASSTSLIYATSEAAKKSSWMPWELGYMDARTGLVCVAPIAENEARDFRGREYLSLYPYLDLSGTSLYIHRDADHFVGFDRWQRQGAKP